MYAYKYYLARLLTSTNNDATFHQKMIPAYIALGILMVIALIVSLYFAFRKDNFGEIQKKKNSVFNVRVYTYDYARERFYSFDRMNLRNKKEYDKESFYNQFVRSDVMRIENWLNSIINEKDAPEVLQVVAIINKGKKNISSLLNFTSINREQQVVHFESQFIPYMRTYRTRKSREKKLFHKYTLRNLDECAKFLSTTDADVLGSIVYYSVYSSRKTLTDAEKQTLKQTQESVYNLLGNYLCKTRKIYRVNDSDSIVIDLTCLSKLMAMNVTVSIQKVIQQLLNKSTEDLGIDVAIGISIGTFYHGDLSLGIKQSKKMVDAIIGGMSKNSQVLLYDEMLFTNYELNKMQKDETRALIKNATFRLYFTPTVNLENGSQSMHLLKILPYGTSATSMNDVLMTSCNIKNGPITIFGKILKKAIAEAKKQNTRVPIAIEIPYSMFHHFYKVYQTSKANIDWIVCLRETSLAASHDDQNVMMKKIRDFKSVGGQVALIVDNINLTLRSRILKLLNYILIPNVFTCKAKDSDQAKNDLRMILSAYSSYHIPFVFYGLEHIDDIETGIINGGSIFQCDELALPSSKLEKIPLETIEYLLKDAEKLAPKRIQSDLIEKAKQKNNTRSK